MGAPLPRSPTFAPKCLEQRNGAAWRAERGPQPVAAAAGAAQWVWHGHCLKQECSQLSHGTPWQRRMQPSCRRRQQRAVSRLAWAWPECQHMLLRSAPTTYKSGTGHAAACDFPLCGVGWWGAFGGHAPERVAALCLQPFMGAHKHTFHSMLPGPRRCKCGHQYQRCTLARPVPRARPPARPPAVPTCPGRALRRLGTLLFAPGLSLGPYFVAR